MRKGENIIFFILNMQYFVESEAGVRFTKVRMNIFLSTNSLNLC